MKLTYRQEGDYYYPNLKAPEAPKIGKYGILRRDYLKRNKRAIYGGMMLSGTLNNHLEMIDREANQMVERLTNEMAKAEGVNEEMKRTDQLKWVGMMNSLKASAEEIVLRELVYS